MDIFSAITYFLQNHTDGKAIVQRSSVSADDVHKVTQEVLPKITNQVKKSPQTLGDLFEIYAKKQNDPESLLNAQPGFNHQTAHNEGKEILQTLFGDNNQTERLTEEVSQKTGVSAVDISALLPLIATMATKLLGGKADNVAAGKEDNVGVGKESKEGKQDPINELLGFLDANKDGSISDDLGRIGRQIIGNLYTRH